MKFTEIGTNRISNLKTNAYEKINPLHIALIRIVLLASYGPILYTSDNGRIYFHNRLGTKSRNFYRTEWKPNRIYYRGERTLLHSHRGNEPGLFHSRPLSLELKLNSVH